MTTYNMEKEAGETRREPTTVSTGGSVSEDSQRLKQLTTFSELGKAITSTLDLKEILNVVMEKISDLLQPKNWSLLLVDEEKDELYFEIVVGEGADKIKDIRLKIGEGIAGWVAKEGAPLLVPDVNKDPRFYKKVDESSKFTTKSIIAVPLKSRGKCLGVIELINKMFEHGGFKEEDLLVLTTLADYTAIAIENAKFFQRIQELTITDDLTKLYNSRHLYRFLDYETERAKRYKSHIAMIFLDMDKFKEVNDTYGHLNGSKLLTEVAKIISNGLRKVDMACRYGGDEFAIVMPQTSKKQAYLAAEKLRTTINEHMFLKDDGLNLKITASFGVASIPDDAKDTAELIHLSDKAMYRVKNSTRNAVELA
ncbi:MAG: sensor domain-containing diguanylate cyclase [Deltaproteobacteria bacterium]|nr:sensor domain-containing diguanylate cyclase [Deltaproteobacteria bacterium]